MENISDMYEFENVHDTSNNKIEKIEVSQLLEDRKICCNLCNKLFPDINSLKQHTIICINRQIEDGENSEKGDLSVFETIVSVDPKNVLLNDSDTELDKYEQKEESDEGIKSEIKQETVEDYEKN